MQIDSKQNKIDRTNELDLNLNSGVLTIGDNVFSSTEINSMYLMKVNCGKQQTQFNLEISQDCTDNEIVWTTTLGEILYHPYSQTEELVNFGYSQTIPGCKVTCDYEVADCTDRDAGICTIRDFSSDLQQFYIQMDSASGTYNASITCTSEVNQKTITDEFTIKFDEEDALTCEGY